MGYISSLSSQDERLPRFQYFYRTGLALSIYHCLLRVLPWLRAPHLHIMML